MKQFLIAAAMVCLLALPAAARDVALPAKHPTVTVSIPDNWKTDEIEYGWNAMSPGKDVFFSIEAASSKKLDALLKNNQEWMNENKIKMVKPEKSEEDFNGMSGTVLRFDTTDEDGPTRVDFIMLAGGADNVVMLTLWGSAKERADHRSEVEALMKSVRPAS
jgi:opacity protein-like surface antigen